MPEDEQIPTPDTVPEAIDDPTSPDVEPGDQLPYPDVEGVVPDEEDDDE